jgi:ketosteroid isomerase-like protein
MGKNWLKKYLAVIIIAVVTFSCNSKKKNNDTTSGTLEQQNNQTIIVDSLKATQELLSKDIEFSEYCVKNGINESFTNYIADDGVLLRPNHHPVVGKDSVIKLLNNKNKNNLTMRWKPSYAFVAKSGELGYTYGVYELSDAAPDGAVISSSGTYVSIWKKDSSGNWKLALDCGNEGLAPVKKNKKD